jgi:hypothetical protein
MVLYEEKRVRMIVEMPDREDLLVRAAEILTWA